RANGAQADERPAERAAVADWWRSLPAPLLSRRAQTGPCTPSRARGFSDRGWSSASPPQSWPGSRRRRSSGSWNLGLLLRSDIVGDRTPPRRNDRYVRDRRLRERWVPFSMG